MQREEFNRRSYELYDRVRERVNGTNIKEGEEYLSALELAMTLHDAIAKHNVILKDKVEADLKQLNKIARRLRLLNKKVPYISSITPVVHEDTTQELRVTFMEEGRVKGSAVIKPDLSITFDFLKPEYSMKDVLDLLRKNHLNYLIYFNALNSFMCEYPGIDYEFGKGGASNNSYQILTDGFLDAKINLNGDCVALASFNNCEDLELSRNDITPHGEVYDYLQYYTDNVLNSFRVDESQLNPFFKRVLENKRELAEAETPSERVLRV